MAIIVKDENNARTTPIIIKENEAFPNQQVLPLQSFPGDHAVGSSIVVLNNEPHILGAGETYINPLTQQQSIRYNGHYKYSNGEWEYVGTTPIVMGYGAAVVLNDEIYLLDYYNFYKYSNGEWNRVGAMPYDFRSGAAVVLNDEIHILGGMKLGRGDTYSDDETISKYHYKYSNGEWVPVSTLPFRFYDVSSATVFNNELYIFNLSSFYKYSNDEWVEVGELPAFPYIPNNPPGRLGNPSYYYTRLGVFCIACHDGLHLFTSLRYHHGDYYTTDYFKHYIYISSNEWVEYTDIPTAQSIGSNYINISLNTFSAFIVENEGGDIQNIYCIYLNEYSAAIPHYLVETIDYFVGRVWEFESSLPYQIDPNLKFSAVVLNGEIHIMGGGVDINDCDAHYKYSNGEWQSVSQLPYSFYDGDAVVLNNEIHILGSRKAGNYRLHYKYSNGEWIELGDLPFDFKNNHSAVIYNGEINIIDNATGDQYKYSNNEWVWVSNMSYTTTSEITTVVLNDEIHLMSGTNHYKYSNGEWEICQDSMPYYFIGGAAVVLNDEIHILGGNYRHDPLCNTYHYKYSNGEWVSVSTIPYPFYNCPAVVLDNKINVLGLRESSNWWVKHYVYDELMQHIFNKIKGIWTKIKVPTYDEYGNCHMEEQAKRVKAVWVGGPDNKAKRVY